MAFRPKHEVEASGQLVQNSTQALKLHSIKKEATQIACLTNTAHNFTKIVELLRCDTIALNQKGPNFLDRHGSLMYL